MGTAAVSSKGATSDARAGVVDMKLEVVILPVSDVERAKKFYGSLGWRLDADFTIGDSRVVQFTPPGPSARSTSARIRRPPRRDRSRTCS